jgi:hypothetical protein
MASRAGWGLAFLMLSACGGRAQSSSASTAGASNEAGGTASGAGTGSELAGSGAETGGADAASGTAGEAGTLSAAGASSGFTSLIRSGTRSCENEDYCFGLACYAPADFGPMMCLLPCRTDADCEPDEACARAPQLRGTCYARCASPVDCYYGFSCFDFSREGEFMCFPTAWTSRRDELGYD